MKLLKKAAAGAATAGILAGGMLFTAAQPASAAVSCNWVVKYDGAWLPGYVSGSTVTRECQLAQGNDNEGVRQLQTTLKKCYGRSLDEDGVFGSLTKSALIYAQKKAFPNDSSQWDGIYGPNTRKGILHEATTSGCKRVN
ncbi:peptidoglycan-binding domain-containing protein [Streptomyces violaceus]|uniref:Peptidoglycan-binding protein n=1 Tax=Streptomyces violaceus TaxID=1936 RepID=A0ABZ1NL50_STRVL